MIEKVQRRETERVKGLSNQNYDERLSKLNLFSLEFRRLRGDLIYTRRIVREEMGKELTSFFKLAGCSQTRGHSLKLVKTRRMILTKQVTLSTRVVNDWNSLPEFIIEASSEKRFKSMLDDFYYDTSKHCCPICKRMCLTIDRFCCNRL